MIAFPETRRTTMGFQHSRKELRTASKKRRKATKHKLRSTKKYKIK